MAAVDAGRVFVVPSFGEFSSKPSSKSKNTGQRLKMTDENEEETNIGIRAPIVGYEVVERREKFTVYKVNVKDGEKSWFVFRRYTDFVRLNDKLENVFRGFHIRLPSKRWFKNNFDPAFIEERAHGLQFFLNNVMRHTRISKRMLFPAMVFSRPEKQYRDIVKQFLCLDDPPGPYDSLEESRAYCQQLEDEIEDIKEKLHETVTELSATKSQLAQARIQQEALVSALKEERSCNSFRKSLTQETNKEPFQPIMDNHSRIVSRKQSSDSRKSDNSQETESTETKDSWAGELQIAAHSKGVDKIKPTPRRTPVVTQPLTSTPTKDSSLDPFKDDNIISDEGRSNEASQFDKTALDNVNSNEVQDVTKDDDAATGSNQSDASDDKEVTGNDTRTGKTPEHSNKRDSGIIMDSPQPLK